MSGGPYQPSSHSNTTLVKRLLLLAVAAIIAYQYAQQGWPFGSVIIKPFPNVIDDDSQKEDVEPDNRNSDLVGSYVVVVEESQSRPPSRVMILNNYTFWFGLRDRGLAGFRIIDPDSPDAASFVAEAARSSISPPFVMHIAADGRVLQTIPFPTDIAEIEAMLK